MLELIGGELGCGDGSSAAHLSFAAASSTYAGHHGACGGEIARWLERKWQRDGWGLTRGC
jgi:hypothetical protein